MLQYFATALGLVLVIEGVIYALFAPQMKRQVARILEMPDEALRIIGLLTALLGLFIVWQILG